MLPVVFAGDDTTRVVGKKVGIVLLASWLRGSSEVREKPSLHVANSLVGDEER